MTKKKQTKICRDVIRIKKIVYKSKRYIERINNKTKKTENKCTAEKK